MVCLRNSATRDFYCVGRNDMGICVGSISNGRGALGATERNRVVNRNTFFSGGPEIDSTGTLAGARIVVVSGGQLASVVTRRPALTFRLLRVLTGEVELLSSRLSSVAFVRTSTHVTKLLLRDRRSNVITVARRRVTGAMNMSEMAIDGALDEFTGSKCVSARCQEVLVGDERNLRGLIGRD